MSRGDRRDGAQTCMAGRAADKRVFLECLKRSSVGLIVEGVAGIFHGATIDAERVYLQQRKGFIKIAMQAGVGASAHPCNCFISQQLCPPCPHARESWKWHTY